MLIFILLDPIKTTSVKDVPNNSRVNFILTNLVYFHYFYFFVLQYRRAGDSGPEGEDKSGQHPGGQARSVGPSSCVLA